MPQDAELAVEWGVCVSPADAGAPTGFSGWDITPAGAGSFAVGDSVYLRGARFGEPGTVLRVERRKVVVLWHDLDYLARHSPEPPMLTSAHKLPSVRSRTLEKPSTPTMTH